MDEAREPVAASAEAQQAEVEANEQSALDVAGLAGQVARARAKLRESHPTCFREEADACAAVVEVDAELAGIEASLRGRTERQPELGDEEVPEGAYIEGVPDAGSGE